MMGRPTLDFNAPGHRQQVADVINAGSEIGYDSLAVLPPRHGRGRSR